MEATLESRPTSFDWKDYLVHGVFFTLYGSVKYLPSPMGDLLRRWISRPFLAASGKIRIYEGVTLWYPYRIRLGSNVTLNEWVYVSGYGGVEIGDGVRIGHRTTIITSDHRDRGRAVPFKDSGLEASPVVIEDDVFIGCNVTILRGVRIGRGSVVAAGSVVTRDVPPFCIVAGSPAKKLRDRL